MNMRIKITIEDNYGDDVDCEFDTESAQNVNYVTMTIDGKTPYSVPVKEAYEVFSLLNQKRIEHFKENPGV